METSNKSVNLLIKAPNPKVNDHLIECQLDWTVKNLKFHISENYPEKPIITNQKLIYSGRLLHDHLKLKDILRHEEEGPHIMHLVCSSKDTSMAPLATTINNVPNYAQGTLPIQSSSTIGEGLRHRTGIQQANQNYSATLSMPTFPVSSEQVAQQMIAMQQMYAYYMTQYIQHVQTRGNLTTVGSDTQTSASSQNPTLNIGANQNAGVVERPVNENVRMNAQGGPLLDDEEEEFRNRDWLDWFYMFSRVLVLFTIVYFYSSPGRFMIVTGLAILAYLYQGGWFRVREQQNANENVRNPERREIPEQRVNNEEPQPPNRSTSVPSENQVNQQENSSNVPQSESLEEESETTEQIQQEDNRPVQFVATAWTFISSFFSSLIPEQPAPVDIN